MNTRRLPWWIPRTRVMRTALIAVAVLMAAAGGWLAKTQVHSFWSLGSPGIALGSGLVGIVIGALLFLALGPIDRS